MALDFPNAPTLNQTFTAPNGVIWVWDGVKWTAITSTSPYVGGGNVGRNLLHNPQFNVAQRGAGGFVASGNYTMDRWLLTLVSDTASVTQFVLADVDRSQLGDESARYCLRNAFTGNAAAGAYNAVSEWIEDVRRLAGKTVTISFWATSTSGTPKLGVSLDQWFGTPGSGGSTQVNGTGQAVTLSAAWARYSLTFTLPSAAGKTLGTSASDSTGLNFWFSSGATNATRAGSVGVQSGTIFLWGVQLEVGSVSTPLEKPDPRYDLSNCQRFYSQGYWYFGGNNAGGALILGAAQLPVTMRAGPSITLAGSNTGINVGAVNCTQQMQNVAIAWAAITTTGYGTINQVFTASADL